MYVCIYYLFLLYMYTINICSTYTACIYFIYFVECKIYFSPFNDKILCILGYIYSLRIFFYFIDKFMCIYSRVYIMDIWIYIYLCIWMCIHVEIIFSRQEICFYGSYVCMYVCKCMYVNNNRVYIYMFIMYTLVMHLSPLCQMSLVSCSTTPSFITFFVPLLE